MFELGNAQSHLSCLQRQEFDRAAANHNIVNSQILSTHYTLYRDAVIHGQIVFTVTLRALFRPIRGTQSLCAELTLIYFLLVHCFDIKKISRFSIYLIQFKIKSIFNL